MIPRSPVFPVPLRSFIRSGFRIPGALLFAGLLPAGLHALQSPEPVPVRETPVLRAAPVGTPLRIDGSLDDPAWEAAEPFMALRQLDPIEGAPATEETRIRVLFDEEALFIGVRAFDRGAPTGRLGRRDMEPGDSDWILIQLDSYHDHRTAFSFALNPSGIQRDGVASMGPGGAEQYDGGWDAVWEGRVAGDPEGWSAEFRIPFGQLRFAPSEAPVWGIQVERIIGRTGERAVLAFTPKDEPGGIPTFGHLEGLRSVRPGQPLEVLPYFLGQLERIAPRENPFREATESVLRVGTDLRYRLTSDFTLTGTINPDFGQVEADPASVNLTTYETFLEEKRPFFVEGGEIFEFDRNVSGGRLFYSRRIGRTPQLSAPSARSDRPDVTTILGAVKLSGKTASGWSVGVIEALTAREEARYLTDDGVAGTATVEPLTNYLVTRVRRDAAAGRVSLGGIFTGVNRQLDSEPLRNALRSSAQAGGMDFRVESQDRRWVLRGSAAFSRVAGTPSAMVRVQTAGNHFFQRPDAEHLEVDPSATSILGYSVGAALQRQGGEHWRGDIQIAATSPGFEPNDLGFQIRTDRRDVNASLGWVQNRPGRFFRNYDLTGSVRYEHNYGWNRIVSNWTLASNFRRLDFSSGSVRLSRYVPGFNDRITRGGPLVTRPGNWTLRTQWASDPRRPVALRGAVLARRDDQGGQTIGGDLSLLVRASEQWAISFGPSWEQGSVTAEYLTTRDDPTATGTFGRRYLFAPLDQVTVAMETRLEVTVSPTLSFQLYAQPFLSSGDYGDPAWLERPGSHAFAPWSGPAPDRDFNLRSLRGTGVARWEYRPGSAIVVAWQQSRSGDVYGDDGAFDLGREARALLDSRPDNLLVVKVTGWWAP